MNLKVTNVTPKCQQPCGECCFCSTPSGLYYVGPRRPVCCHCGCAKDDGHGPFRHEPEPSRPYWLQPQWYESPTVVPLKVDVPPFTYTNGPTCRA